MKIVNKFEFEPCFKIYKMSESVENKYYYGKTHQPFHLRMQQHKEGRLSCDVHFSNVGWNNVLCEIIEAAKNEEHMNLREQKYIAIGKIGKGKCLNIASGVIRVYDPDEKAYIIKILDEDEDV